MQESQSEMKRSVSQEKNQFLACLAQIADCPVSLTYVQLPVEHMLTDTQ